VGPFGGYGGRAEPGPDVHEYEIETVHDEASVKSLKAFVACPGYQVETIVLETLPSEDERTFDLSLTPLPTVGFAGVIRG
jgi:hypothetical protein